MLVLIDVSGSMKERTDENLALSHALTQAAPLVETFTFGTRLTRVTRALRLIARADLELRSSPPDKRLVLERLVYELASEPKPAAALFASNQLSFEV